MKRLCLTLLTIFMLAPVQAKVVLPSLLGDNMVLQRNSSVKLWGQAAPDSKVSVMTSWNRKKYWAKTDALGNWNVHVSTSDAGGPYQIRISDGEEIRLDNILLGDVWICGGQSNMEMPVQGFFGQPCLHSVEAMRDAAKYPEIRMFTVSRSSKDMPQTDCSGEWKISNPLNVGNFSAVGYFFGRCLNQYIDVPIGLIASDWGGSNIEAWMPEGSLLNLDVDHEFIAKTWKNENATPHVLYNGMIAPLINYTAKGFIWYQGEANHRNYFDYKILFVEMVKQWRNAWGNTDMPFYYVQIAPYRYDGAEMRAMALLVENQYRALQEISHSGIAGTNDLGLFSIIHEPDKQSVGERLAYLALSRDYGVKGVPADAPTYKSMEIEGNKIILSFNNMAVSGDENDPRSFSWLDDNLKVITPKGFEIAGADKKFYEATAKLQWYNNKIEVYSDSVKCPVAVRYAFKNYSGELNVKTTLGQPLAPFRTDNWEIPDEEIFSKQ